MYSRSKMRERRFDKGEDDDESTLRQLNNVIIRLDEVKNACNTVLQSGNSGRARQYMSKIAELYDEFNELSLKYFSFIGTHDTPQKALDELEKVMKINESTETFFDTFEIDVDDAITQNFLNLETFKGLFLLQLQKYRLAVNSFETVLNADNSRDGVWFFKGEALAGSGNADEALDAYETAIIANGNNSDAWIGKAQILQSVGNYSESLEAFETALEIDDTNLKAAEGRDAVLSQLEIEVSGSTRQNTGKKKIRDTSTDRSDESAGSSEKGTDVPTKKEYNERKEKKVYKKPVTKKEDDDKPKGFACVAGMLELKELLKRDVIKPLKNPENYKKFNVTIPNGILLYGPPGCGKTFIVEKLAEEVGYNFINVPPSKFGSKYIHETSGNIAKIFIEAKDNAPTILFFDEFEALVPKRASLGAEAQYKTEEINEFLTRLNNASSDGILVVGATNQVDLIDSAVMRAGRMDKVICVPPPDFDARKELFRSKLSRVPHSNDIDFSKLAKATEYYSSSDITAIVESAGRIAGDQELDEINADLMMHVIENQKPSISKSQIKSYETFSHLERK